MPWGTHCCHFYQTQRDLLDTVVPYFKAGLEAREFCLWLIPEPLTQERARRLLRQRIPESDRYVAEGSLEIVPGREWYLKGGRFSFERVRRKWDEKLRQASARGYVGMRANGNAAWLQKKTWRPFGRYEMTLNKSLAGKPMIVLCSYPLQICGAADGARSASRYVGARIRRRARNTGSPVWTRRARVARPLRSPHQIDASVQGRDREASGGVGLSRATGETPA
jgi:hypothetical protein